MEFADVTVKESPGLCRCCLSEGCYKDLGTEYAWMNDTEVYADMLLDCFDIGITQHNEGPNGPKRLICEVCITRLRDACNFKKQVVDSEKKFIDMLGRGEFRHLEKQTVMLPMYSAPMKAETIEEVTVNEEYDDTHVEFLDDNDFTEDDEVKTEGPSNPLPSTSAVKRGRPKKTDSVPEKKPKMKGKAKMPKETALRTEEQLAGLLITIIQHTTILPFRWQSGKFMCSYCPQRFDTSAALKEHDRNGHAEINITDIVTQTMNRDRRIKLDVADAKCHQCDEEIDDLPDLVDHLRKKHGEEFDDSIADYFVSYRLYDTEISCVECGMSFQYFIQLLTHTHQTHMKKQTCKICGQGVAGKTNMYHHMKNSHAMKSCKFCNKTFQTQYALFQHITSNHVSNALKCHECGEVQKNRYKLKRHMAFVHNFKNFQLVCEYCSKVFTRNNKYIQHKERVHYKVKNVTCDVCGYTTYDISSLKLHMICHEETKSYVCECGQTFRRSKNLSAHQMKCTSNYIT